MNNEQNRFCISTSLRMENALNILLDYPGIAFNQLYLDTLLGYITPASTSDIPQLIDSFVLLNAQIPGSSASTSLGDTLIPISSLHAVEFQLINTIDSQSFIDYVQNYYNCETSFACNKNIIAELCTNSHPENTFFIDVYSNYTTSTGPVNDNQFVSYGFSGTIIAYDQDIVWIQDLTDQSYFYIIPICYISIISNNIIF